MLYSLAANAIALLHFLFIVFVVLGGLLVLRWPKLMWVHLPAAIWGVLIEFAGWYCPLTTWENRLLRRAGQEGYSTGFVEHYLFALIYPDGLTRGMQMALGMLVLAINIAVYVRVFQRP
ncbi:MAG TPA: DUF2784 domain-containing protein [Thermoanaerobaculia bacterium]|nr:DUF2784 domain-containing protein [Thermoanaerobaculia bacterium]